MFFNGIEVFLFQPIRQCGFNPSHFSVFDYHAFAQTAFAFSVFAGEKMARARSVVHVLARTRLFEPLGGTFSCFLLWHR